VTPWKRRSPPHWTRSPHRSLVTASATTATRSNDSAKRSNTCTLAYTSTSLEITLDYDLPSFNVVPEDDHVRYIKSRDELSPVHRSTNERRKIYLRLISSLAILTVHGVFTATTADVVDAVTFKGSASEIDPGTGNVSRTCLVSVATTRELFSTLNLAHVDPVDCLEHLGGRASQSPASIA